MRSSTPKPKVRVTNSSCGREANMELNTYKYYGCTFLQRTFKAAHLSVLANYSANFFFTRLLIIDFTQTK